MSTEKDSILACLSSGQDKVKLLNIKLFRGDRDQISEAELRAESHSAIMQRKRGLLTGSREAPKSKLPVVDVRQLVADM